MKSMTGFAKKQYTYEGKNIIIEIKTLNSKQMDANVKLPNRYKEQELAIRGLLNQLERGKIDVGVSEEQSKDNPTTLNGSLVKQRYEDLKSLTRELGTSVSDDTLLDAILKHDDVWSVAVETELSEGEREAFMANVKAAIDDVDATRSHEGGILEKDFEKHIDCIETLLGQIPPYEQERIETAKERIRSYLNDANIKDVDENRFEQELIYYLEKLDITEEKVRLAKHLNYFREVMAKEEGSGKKLGFIAQEMGREINTTGSKANHVEIQRIVVAMKDELEKIKEQLGNIL